MGMIYNNQKQLNPSRISTFFIIIAFLFIGIGNLNAQAGLNNIRNVSLDVTYGLTMFHGDVDGKMSTGASVGLSYNPMRLIGARLSVGFGKLEGFDKPDKYGRFFTNRYYQVMARANINIFELVQLYNSSHIRFYPFGFIGLGIIKSDVKEYNKSDDLSVTGQDYDGVNFNFQIGGGIKFYLNKQFDLMAQYEFNTTNTDLLDGHDPVWNTNLHQDYASVYSIGIVYKIGKKDKTYIDWKSSYYY